MDSIGSAAGSITLSDSSMESPNSVPAFRDVWNKMVGLQSHSKKIEALVKDGVTVKTATIAYAVDAIIDSAFSSEWIAVLDVAWPVLETIGPCRQLLVSAKKSSFSSRDFVVAFEILKALMLIYDLNNFDQHLLLSIFFEDVDDCVFEHRDLELISLVKEDFIDLLVRVPCGDLTKEVVEAAKRCALWSGIKALIYYSEPREKMALLLLNMNQLLMDFNPYEHQFAPILFSFRDRDFVVREGCPRGRCADIAQKIYQLLMKTEFFSQNSVLEEIKQSHGSIRESLITYYLFLSSRGKGWFKLSSLVPRSFSNEVKRVVCLFPHNCVTEKRIKKIVQLLSPAPAVLEPHIRKYIHLFHVLPTDQECFAMLSKKEEIIDHLNLIGCLSDEQKKVLYRIWLDESVHFEDPELFPGITDSSMALEFAKIMRQMPENTSRVRVLQVAELVRNY